MGYQSTGTPFNKTQERKLATALKTYRIKGKPVYRFQIRAYTQAGETIGLVGSAPGLGLWDAARCLRLKTSAALYPLWRTDRAIDLRLPESADSRRIEYKYVRLGLDGRVQWEAPVANRWVPVDSDSGSDIVVDDGEFDCLPPHPFGYFEEPDIGMLQPEREGLKIALIGSSVAAGHKAWLLRGWAWLLGEALRKKYGHRLVNVSEAGTNVEKTIERFAAVLAPPRPDVVIIALSLGNEGFASCPAHERRAVQRRFESGLRRLEKMVRELGARPILGGVYPNDAYLPEHHRLLWETHTRMLSWGIPVLNWLEAVDDGQGRWKPGMSFDPAHPNGAGHRLMYEAIDLSLFDIAKNTLEAEKQHFQQSPEVPVYLDKTGFHISGCIEQRRLRITNPSQYNYTIAPYWQELQTVLRCKAGLVPGVYMAKQAQKGTLPFFAVREDGTIETTLDIPPGTNLEYSSAHNFFSPHNPQLLFYDGHLGILKENEQRLRVINESDHEYNIHPMWQEVRGALKAMQPGVYEDPLHSCAFRTVMIGKDGLESRVRVPPGSAVSFEYKCKLSDISRAAIIPLGDRCAIRMLLYKMGYDGPAFPFDLTRTTGIGDVADMIESRFQGMWDPALLHYSSEASRIYHLKWTGLSFAHEVEATDDPSDLRTVHERMRQRYTARSERFWYTIRNCDRALFIRTGSAGRDGVVDLVRKLEKQCQGKPFRLLLISPQASSEFSELDSVLHYNLEFNPDRMYADLDYWMHCTQVMHGILESLGISSKNLFWCPPNPPQVAPDI